MERRVSRRVLAVAVGAVLTGLALSLGAAEFASAADVNGKIEPNGVPVAVTTSEPSQNARFTFGATQGQRVYLRVSGIALSPSGSYEIIDLLDPSGARLGGTGAVSSTGFIDTKTLPSSGTYTILVDPAGVATGTTTLTLFDVPPDFTASLALDGDAVLARTTVAGQDARLTFDGVAGTQVYLDRGGVTISSSTVKILRPDGSLLVSTGVVSTQSGSTAAQLPVSGTYTAHVDGFKDAVGEVTLMLSSEPLTVGALIADQSEALGDDTARTPASAQPISPNGPASPGTFSTELWEASETGVDDGLEVVSSTAPGTAAITGVAIDATTNQPVQGATATIQAPGVSYSTTTNATGAYAFIDIPASAYDISVAAAGLGSSTLANAEFAPGETYQLTASLDGQTQVFDELALDADVAQVTTSEPPGDLYSNLHVPPSIRVKHWAVWPERRERVPGQENCWKKPDDQQPAQPPVLDYPFDYYLLRVALGEVHNLNLNAVGFRAFAALAQNYAWFWKTRGSRLGSESADVGNYANGFQCFRDYSLRKIPSGWRALLHEVLERRIVGDNGLYETIYEAGSEECPPPGAQGPGEAWQNRIKTMSLPGACQYTDWRNLATWFYPGTQAPFGTLPPPPEARFALANGGIIFKFESKVRGINVAWNYQVERFASELPSPQWRTVRFVGWRFTPNNTSGCSQPARDVPLCASAYVPPNGGCHLYRARARNPVGWSKAARFVNVAPGQGYSLSGACQP